jgi:hypothetical protein
MTIHKLVDDLYEAFASRIGPSLSAGARDLPRALRLAREALPWSQVFDDEVTLGAPALLAESMAGVPATVTHDAVLAHLLAVIDSFGIARIEDERIEASPRVFAVLGHARRERDLAMVRLFSRTPLADTDFRAADAMTIRALRRERSMLKSTYPANLDLYAETLLDQRCSWSLASVALARIAGFGQRRYRAVRAALESISVALQIHDHVADWETDVERGGSWVLCLMRGMQGPPSSGCRPTRGDTTRGEVLKSGVLEVMLSCAHQHMRAARRRATALRARRLASWAATQEGRLESLVAAQADGTGYSAGLRAVGAGRR